MRSTIALLVFLPLWLYVRVELRNTRDLSSAIVVTGIAWASGAIVITEVLSLFGIINAWSLAFSWAMLSGISFLLLRRKHFSFSAMNGEVMSKADSLILDAVGVICFITLVTALVSVPNNWDSMTYHLSRVEHWLQNGSLLHFPTTNERQLYSGPFAEILILNFLALSGDHYFSNAVQWLAMVGTLFAAASVTKRLGGGVGAQLMGALFVVTLPMGILQSSSTQNDYAVAFFIICAVDRMLAWQANDYDLRNGFLLGAALGLAVLTKGTAYLYLAPMLIILAMVGRRTINKRVIVQFGAIAVIAITINAGHFARNLDVFGVPFGPSAEVRNEKVTPASVYSNLVRDLGSNLYSPFKRLNDVVEASVVSTHRVFDIDLNNPASTFLTERFGFYPDTRYALHEDSAGNPLHVLLGIVALVIVVAWSRADIAIIGYTAGVVLAFLTFAVLLKWNPWITRLLLPGMVLCGPIAGLAAGRLPANRRAILAGLLFLSAMPWALSTFTRPILPAEKRGIVSIFHNTPEEVMFAARPGLRTDYIETVSWLGQRKAKSLGLLTDGDSWEFPIWWLVRKFHFGDIKIGHACVDRPPARLLVTELVTAPDYLIATDVSFEPNYVCEGQAYRLAQRFGALAIYDRKQ